MNRALAFWMLCSVVMLALWLVTLGFGIHRRNWAFGAWATSGVAAELVLAGLYVLRARLWLERVSEIDFYLGIAIALGAVVEAIVRSRRAGTFDSVSFTVILGLGAILAVNLAQGILAGHARVISTSVWVWFRNIGFFAPALWMLMSFSNVNLNSLLLRVSDAIAQAATSDWQTASRSIFG